MITTARGVLGLAEYFFPAIRLELQSPAFPPGVQFLHFFAVLVTGALFVLGYATRWSHTPLAVVIMYSVLATLCFVETVDFGAFGGGTARFVPMTIEYVVYVLIGTYLLRSAAMVRHFG
ncbi:MAG: hypothetical protein AAFX94_21595, partial [Myxococcota bacterium]